MAEISAPYQLYVGIDIAADTSTAAWLMPGGSPTRPFSGDQTPVGYAALQRHLQATTIAPAATLVVLEATSTYWVALAVVLYEAGYCVGVVNPRQAHHFAKAQLRRAKTDALDAQDLAQLAAALTPAPWTPPPAVYHEALRHSRTWRLGQLTVPAQDGSRGSRSVSARAAVPMTGHQMPRRASSRGPRLAEVPSTPFRLRRPGAVDGVRSTRDVGGVRAAQECH
jgi:Transposase